LTRLTPPDKPAAPAARRLSAGRAPGAASPTRRQWLVATAALWLAPRGFASTTPALTFFEINRDDDAVALSYAVDFELAPGVEDALSKGIALHFVAEASVFRNRWYWRDRRIAQAARRWRVVYQPLTSNYRVSFGGLSRSYASRAEALAAVRRSVRWRIAEPGQVEPGSRHYLEFSFRLDTSQLPRPIQIGIEGQDDWSLLVERAQAFD
jgi:Domain of unknown function (DUF4390)